MAEMVTYLLRRRLVTRERDEDNSRQYLLSLSENRSTAAAPSWSGVPP
jgi:DNA-binding MarR family transcriptional regulator